MSTKTRRILFAVGLVALVVLVILFHIYEVHRSPTYYKTSVNKDTGQTVVTDPNQGPEMYDSQYVTILGTDKFISAGMTEDQLNLTNSLVTNYINHQLKRAYTQVAFLNDGFSFNGSDIKSQMRLGNSNLLLSVDITYASFSEIEIKITSSFNSSTYNYDSGHQLVASPTPLSNDQNVNTN